jgi:hypothetical protein
VRDTGLKQTVTYWPPAATDRFGAETYSAPILLRGRWEERNEEAATLGGDTIVSRAIVFVDRDLLVGGFLAEGDQLAVQDPTILPSAYEIRAWRSIPDLRNVSSERRAIL